MRLLSGRITLTDLISKDNKSETDELLRTITKSEEKTKSMTWISTMSGGGVYEAWNFSEIPPTLGFFENVRILVSSFYFLPVSYAVLIEGTLSNEILKELETLDDKTCRDKIERFRIEFWNYWKNTFHGIITDPNFRYYPNGTGITDFCFKIESPNELVEINGDESGVLKKLRRKPIFLRYGVNTGGLISITELFSNKISIISQGAAIFGPGGLDFSWITKFEFYTEEDLFRNMDKESQPIFLRNDSLFQIHLAQVWLDYRISEIDKWKNKISAFSKELEKLQMRGKKLKSKEMEMSPLSEKRAFLTDFTSILDENRLVAKFLQEQQRRYNETVGGERTVPGTMAARMENEGFLYNFYKSLSNRNNIIKEEYGVLDNQYEILSAHLNQLLSLVNAKSSVQLSESNKWTQRVVIGLAAVTLIVTIAIYDYNGNLVKLTQQLVDDSSDTKNLLSAIDRSNGLTLASLYSNYELKLQYEIDPFDEHGLPIGRVYNLWVTNFGDYDAQINSTYYINDDLCNRNGSHFYPNRAQIISNNSVRLSDIIVKKGMQDYTLQISKIYPNFTNLRSFTLEIVAKGTPVEPDNAPVQYFTKSKITRVQFVYDNITKIWIPELGWDELNCNAKPQEFSDLFLYTTNETQFRDIG